MNTYILAQIALLIVLVMFSAFFSASETALFSLSKVRVKRLQLENRPNAKRVARLLDHPTRLLVSILIGNMLVNILASSTASIMIMGFFGERALGFSIAAMTFLILIFGEITPKSVAIANPEKMSLRVAFYINAFSVAVYPIRRVLRLIADFFVKQFSKKFKLKKDQIGLTADEFKKAVTLGRSEGVFDVDEEKMFKGIFEFGDKEVRDIMHPKEHIMALEANTPLDKIKVFVKEKELSRIPVYAGSADNIIGILYAKDLIVASGKGDVDIKQILRTPFYVSSDIRLGKLFNELRTQRVHMALVKDDKGKLAGLATIKDLLEEIIGEIRDTRETKQ